MITSRWNVFLEYFNNLIFWFSFCWTWSYNVLLSLQKDYRSRQGKVYDVIYEILYRLVLDRHALVLNNSLANYNYSLTEILFTTLWNLSLYILIYKSNFLPLNTNNTSPLYIPLHRTYLNWFLSFIIGKIIPYHQEKLICIRQYLELF